MITLISIKNRGRFALITFLVFKVLGRVKASFTSKPNKKYYFFKFTLILKR